MKNGLMFSLICLALLALQVQARVETFNDFTAVVESQDLMLMYPEVISLGYDTTEDEHVQWNRPRHGIVRHCLFINDHIKRNKEEIGRAHV